MEEIVGCPNLATHGEACRLHRVCQFDVLSSRMMTSPDHTASGAANRALMLRFENEGHPEAYAHLRHKKTKQELRVCYGDLLQVPSSVSRMEWLPVVPFGGTGYDAYLRLFAGAPLVVPQAGDGPLQVLVPALMTLSQCSQCIILPL